MPPLAVAEKDIIWFGHDGPGKAAYLVRVRGRIRIIVRARIRVRGRVRVRVRVRGRVRVGFG